MEEEVFDVLEEELLSIEDALKKRFSFEGDAVKDMQYKIWDGINTEANPGLAPSVIVALEDLPANLKANLPKSIKKKLVIMGLKNKLKVQSNLRIETINVLKKEVGKKPLKMYENDYYRLFRLKNYGLHIGGHHYCIAKELVSRERKSVRTILRRWGDRTSKCTLGGEDFLVIKDFDGKILELRQGFQKYKRLTKIRIEVFVLGKEVRIGDMAWNIEIFLPEIEVEGRMPGAEKGLWELLTKDMRECPEAGLSFEEAMKKLNACVEKEEQRIDNAKIAEEKAMEGLNLFSPND